MLILLAGIILLRAKPEFQLDEDRFVYYADNLCQGFYADPISKFIWNGPGYPLLLVPFRWLGIPLIIAKLLNAFFLVGSLRYMQKTLALYVSPQESNRYIYYASVYIVLFGFSWMHLLMTEFLALFCLSGFLFYFCATRDALRFGKIHLIAAVFLAMLVLTKYFFGYVLLCMIISGVLGLFWNIKPVKFGSGIGAFAMLLCTPYLIYTYHLTGKFFYWGNTGGEQLYSLTLPEKHLLGDIVPLNRVEEYPELFPSEIGVVRAIANFNHVQRDSALRKASLQNIRSYPSKFFQNWRANVNRLIFDYPFSHFPGSHSQEKTGNLGFIFSGIWFAMLFCLIPIFRRSQVLAPEFRWALIFMIVSIGGQSLVSAYARFVFPLLPIMLCWVILSLIKMFKSSRSIDSLKLQ